MLGLLVAIGVLLAASGGPAQDSDWRSGSRSRTSSATRPVRRTTSHSRRHGVGLDAGGTEIGTAVTDDKGVALIPGAWQGRLHGQASTSDSLPDGKGLAAVRPPSKQCAADSFITATRTVNFFTGESQSASQSQVDRVAQRFADGVRLGLIIAMCSVGLSLIFGTTGLTNFAHGEMVTFGAHGRLRCQQARAAHHPRRPRWR